MPFYGFVLIVAALLAAVHVYEAKREEKHLEESPVIYEDGDTANLTRIQSNDPSTGSGPN